MTIYFLFYVSFNPHSRKGSDDRFIGSFRQNHGFNPHSRKGSDDYSHWILVGLLGSFNPHSRKGSDSKNKQLYSSIHYKNW